MGFRPLSLDELMQWSQHIADQQHWDVDAVRQNVMSTWLDQAPAEVELLANIGHQHT